MKYGEWVKRLAELTHRYGETLGLSATEIAAMGDVKPELIEALLAFHESGYATAAPVISLATAHHAAENFRRSFRPS